MVVVLKATAVQSAGRRLVSTPPVSAGPQYFHRFCGTSSATQTETICLFSEIFQQCGVHRATKGPYIS